MQIHNSLLLRSYAILVVSMQMPTENRVPPSSAYATTFRVAITTYMRSTPTIAISHPHSCNTGSPPLRYALKRRSRLIATA